MGIQQKPIFQRFHHPSPVIDLCPHTPFSFNFLKVSCIVEYFAVKVGCGKYKVPPPFKITIQKTILFIESLQKSCWPNYIKFGTETKIFNFNAKNKEGEKWVIWGPLFLSFHSRSYLTYALQLVKEVALRVSEVWTFDANSSPLLLLPPPLENWSNMLRNVLKRRKNQFSDFCYVFEIWSLNLNYLADIFPSQKMRNVLKRILI